MGTATRVRTTANGPTDLHSECWRTLSRASALGCDVSYLPTGQPVPADAALVACVVCADRWIVARDWLPALRRAMLALAVRDAQGLTDAA